MQKLPRDFQAFVIATILVALALMLVLSPDIRWEEWPELLLFVVLIALSSMFTVPNPRGGAVSATPTLFYILFTVYGPGAGVLIAGTAYAVGAAVSRGWVPWRTFFNGAQFGISAAVGGAVFKAAGGSTVKLELFSFFLPFALAALAHQMSNNFFVIFLVSRLHRSPLLSTWISEVKDFLWTDILSVVSAAFLAILYVSVHPAILLLYLTFLPLQVWALHLYLQQRRLYAQAIDSLVVAIDSNFPEGRGHSRKVAETAVAIARQMNLSDQKVENIEMAALLHDVGMIGLDDVLQSSEVVESRSIERLREHASLGAKVALELPRRGSEVAEIVLSHHESYDGTGYPQGLQGEQIPLGGRVVALAEAYESMMASASSVRPSPLQAVEIIKGQSGKTLDPGVVSAFLSVLEKGELAHEGSPLGDVKTHIVEESGATG